MDQIPDNFSQPNPASHIHESRRRRTHPVIIPTGKTEHACYVNEIAKRLTPGLDFYFYSMLCALVLGAAILLDHPAMYVLATLLAPFLYPLIGLGFSSAIGSFRFFLQSLGSFLIGAALIFFGGLLSGWCFKLFENRSLTQIQYHLKFSVPDLILLAVGAALAVYTTVRIPKQRSMIASIALAYEIYLPIGVAGFGLASGNSEYFSQALKVTLINILLVILLGSIVLAFLKLRPFTSFGYVFSAVILIAIIYALVTYGALGSTVKKQIDLAATNTPRQVASMETSPTPSFTSAPPTQNSLFDPEATPTNTLVPTRTPTITITPKPTEAWAKISTDPKYNGINVRTTPGFDEGVLTSVLNGTLVQVLPVQQKIGNTIWVLVILEDGQQGWIVQSLLVTNTPMPN